MSFEISDIWITIGKTVGLLIGTFITIKLIKLLMSKSITRILKLRDSIQEESNYDRRVTQRATTLTVVSDYAITIFFSVLASLIFLDIFKINLAPLLAAASVIGVAIGFGAQTLVKDFIAGISNMAEDQFGVGDVVDLGEAIGVVESVTLKSTRVRSLDGTLWHIPNGSIERVANKSQEWSRMVLDISVAYKSDLKKVEKTIANILEEFSKLPEIRESLIDSPELLGVERLADSSIDFRVMARVKAGKQWEIARKLRFLVKERFDEAEIEFPFPQLTIWRGEAEGGN
ncbi:MAG: mechanosensitive ion channel family protein [Actinomycetota bacterium]|jgi:moderate conductance mechanosensitive channel|tara:strand:+ start:720 stop:1580 length:861 start_codon:yes stop_codon:yes gene_type:complete